MADAPILAASSSGPLHRVAAAAAAIVIAAIALISLPYSRVALTPNPSFLPAFAAMTFISELLTGCLLLSQAQLERSRSSLRLGVAYLFSAAVLIPHMLAFPGVFAASPVIGGDASAVWLWVVWHVGFAFLIVCFLLGKPGRLRSFDMLVTLAWLSGAVLVLTLVATVGLPWLPIILVHGNFERLNALGISPLAVGLNVLATVLLVVKFRFRDTLSLWLSVSLLAATVDVVLTLYGGGRYTLGWYVARSLSLITGITVLIALLSELVRQAARVADVNGQLERLLHTDVLTAVNNRRAFEASFAIEWRRARREESPLSLAMIDIDYFKGFNDRYGHPAGDICLREVAAEIVGQLQRAPDAVSRVGGEEFVLLLPNTDEGGAFQVAERVRIAVAALRLAHAASPLGFITVSVGVATTRVGDDGDDPQALLDAADRQLYRAKAAGRNTVCAPFIDALPLVAA